MGVAHRPPTRRMSPQLAERDLGAPPLKMPKRKTARTAREPQSSASGAVRGEYSSQCQQMPPFSKCRVR
jgi:hypothetical protein